LRGAQAREAQPYLGTVKGGPPQSALTGLPQSIRTLEAQVAFQDRSLDSLIQRRATVDGGESDAE
jgi:hypothetical protein